VEQGFAGVMQTFDNTRPLVAAMAVGVGRAALEELRGILTEAGVEISYDTPVYNQHAAAAEFIRLEADWEAAYLLSLRAAWMADNKKPNSLEASMSKAKAGRTGTDVTLKAVELAGTYGYSQRPLLEKWGRDSKILDIFEGTQQIQHLVDRSPPARQEQLRSEVSIFRSASAPSRKFATGPIVVCSHLSPVALTALTTLKRLGTHSRVQHRTLARSRHSRQQQYGQNRRIVCELHHILQIFFEPFLMQNYKAVIRYPTRYELQSWPILRLDSGAFRHAFTENGHHDSVYNFEFRSVPCSAVHERSCATWNITSPTRRDPHAQPVCVPRSRALPSQLR
jgi:hypothetical protein